MNTSFKIAIGIFLALLAWFTIRTVLRGSLSTHKPAITMEAETTTPEATTIIATAQQHEVTVGAKGRTAPDKAVTVKAGTTGTIVSTPVREGNFVKQGTLLCGLDVEARAARL